MKKIIIASTSTVHQGNYLDYLLPHLKTHFNTVRTVTFIPYARPGGISHDAYTQKARACFKQIGLEVVGLHEYDNAQEGIKKSEAFFTGGGNTFLLVKQLHQHKLIDLLAERIHNGAPYLGTSAGSNICGLTMETTNDMPIVYPPSFQTLGLVPFNINPHYLDPDPNSTHMGETRETRILEFHAFNPQPVVGLREGSWLEVKGDYIVLKGELSARIFEQNKQAYEVKPETDLSSLN